MMRRACCPALFLLLLAIGCRQPPAPEDYVARVGDTYLTPSELEDALESLPLRQDSAQVQRQIIEQWVTNELLYQEAVRENLRDDPEVRRRLEANERSVLIDALVSQLYGTEDPTQDDLQAYYDRYRERLRLREPYVRIRHLAVASADSAALARQLLDEATRRDSADARWPALSARFATGAQEARTLANTYIPESRLFPGQPALRQALNTLRPGQIAPVVAADSVYFVLQLADRVPAGSIPELAWIEEEVRRQLLIDARKQMYARHVQRLRNEAQARNALVIR